MTSNSLLYILCGNPIAESVCDWRERERVRERGREGSQFISTSEEWTNSL